MFVPFHSIPEVLYPYDNHMHMYDVIDGYNNDTVAAVQARINTTLHHMPEGALPAYSRVLPHLREDGFDHTKAIVSPLPYSIDLNPTMFLRAEMTANLDEKQRQHIAFPNSVKGFAAYNLTSQALARIRQGDYVPLVDQQLRALEKEGITHADIFGYSQGAPIGLALAEQAQKVGTLEIGTVLAIEAANAEKRTQVELFKAFTAAGLPELNRAINGSGNPTLTELANAGPGVLNRLRQIRGFGNYSVGMALKPNRALGQSFTLPTFNNQIETVIGSEQYPTRTQVFNVRMGDSAIYTEDGLEATDYRFGEHPYYDSLTVPGYGHEAGDHILMMALLGRMAFSRRPKPIAARSGR